VADRLSKEERSKNMAAVRSKNTTPEITVRRALHARGLRFRLNRKDLPGRPDIVLPRLNICIFVHGCFWHQHLGCKRATIPKSNTEFWNKKLSTNCERDEHVVKELRSKGWNVGIIWECEIRRELDSVLDRILFTIQKPPGN
jgi:DNA mismatch endonuclease (patch repair protein)